MAAASLEDWLRSLGRGPDGVFGHCEATPQQQVEIAFRQRIAERSYHDYLAEAGRHHSIPVMDAEVQRFLAGIPAGGWIADIGGCWGWHWRNLSHWRPDVRVVIVELVRGNLRHAQRLLGDAIDRNVYLVHGDATRLQLPDASVDGYWSVQTLQHVPDFEKAVGEAHRILRPSGQFAIYSLNDAPVIRGLFGFLGKRYHRAGKIADAFYLERLSARQIAAVHEAFGQVPQSRFSELLFNPDLGLRSPGAFGSWLGAIDARLSGPGFVGKLIARQHSLHALRRG